MDNEFFMKTIYTAENIYTSGSDTTSPLIKWGINVSKMRRRAFQSYNVNYEQGVEQWPEFKQEYDYRLSFTKEKTKHNNKRFSSLFPLRFF